MNATDENFGSKLLGTCGPIKEAILYKKSVSTASDKMIAVLGQCFSIIFATEETMGNLKIYIHNYCN